MPKVNYIQPDGTRQTLEVPAGTTVMQAAIEHGVAGIVGECGGSASCATCHVEVAPEFREKVPPISDMESEMLDFAAAGRREGSRLGCQIELTDALDGLVVMVPETQV